MGVLGRDQSFSARRAREVLGWAPRVGYEAGLDATLAWLNDEHLAPVAAAVDPASPTAAGA